MRERNGAFTIPYQSLAITCPVGEKSSLAPPALCRYGQRGPSNPRAVSEDYSCVLSKVQHIEAEGLTRKHKTYKKDPKYGWSTYYICYNDLKLRGSTVGEQCLCTQILDHWSLLSRGNFNSRSRYEVIKAPQKSSLYLLPINRPFEKVTSPLIIVSFACFFFTFL